MCVLYVCVCNSLTVLVVNGLPPILGVLLFLVFGQSYSTHNSGQCVNGEVHPPTIPSFVCRGYALLACGINCSAHLTPWELAIGANNMLSAHLTPWELTTGANNMLSATSRLLLLSEAGSSMGTLPMLCLWYCAKDRSLLAS